MQIKYIVATIASSVAFNGVAALPASEITDVSIIEARDQQASQMSQHVSAIEAAAVQLQEAKVNFQAAKLEAAKAMIANSEKAHQMGHAQLQPGEIEHAKDIVARAEQANQAQAAKAGEQGKQAAQGVQKAACYPYCGGGYGAAGYAYGAGAGFNLNVLGLLNIGAGAGYYGAGYAAGGYGLGGYGVW